MQIHLMYAVVIAGLVLAVWLTSGAQPPEPESIEAGYYCVGDPDGSRAYVPGRVLAGEAYVIRSGREREYVPIKYLFFCDEGKR